MKATAKRFYIDLFRLSVNKTRIIVYPTSVNRVTAVRFDGSTRTLPKVGIVYPICKGKAIDVEFLEEKE